MNRYRVDTPYSFSPPKYSSFWAPIIYRFSDHIYLRRRHRVAAVKIAAGGEELLRHYKRGDSLLIAPNHSDHCDPHVLLHLARRYKIPIHFMAARQIFEKKKGVHGRILQKAGVFSIDREASDLRSIKTAMRILSEGRYPLVMFPEGEIYHLNEQLTPLNEGAATLGLRTAKKIAQENAGQEGRDRGVFIIPTAMKYRYVDDISSSFPDRMAKLEEHITWSPQDDLEMVDRVYKFGEALLALKEKELLGQTLAGNLVDRLDRFREILVVEEENRYFSETSAENLPTRIRRLRGKIRTILVGGEKPAPDVVKQCYKSLDRLHVAIQLYSYPGQYLRTKSSMDRIGETIHKFEEDIFDMNRIVGRRCVEVTFGKPVDLVECLAEFKKDQKATIASVTARVETAISDVLA